MAIWSSRTPRAPRPGWSAALMKSRLSPRSNGLRTRLSRAAAMALFDDGEFDAAGEQCIGGVVGVGLAGRHLAFLTVADGDGDMIEGAADDFVGRGGALPEHGAIIEIEDGERSAGTGFPGG